MKKQTTLDAIVIDRDGSVTVRFNESIVDDDGRVIPIGMRHVRGAAGADLDVLMASVNAGTEWAPIDAAEIEKVRALSPSIWLSRSA